MERLISRMRQICLKEKLFADRQARPFALHASGIQFLECQTINPKCDNHANVSRFAVV